MASRRSRVPGALEWIAWGYVLHGLVMTLVRIPAFASLVGGLVLLTGLGRLPATPARRAAVALWSAQLVARIGWEVHDWLRPPAAWDLTRLLPLSEGGEPAHD